MGSVSSGRVDPLAELEPYWVLVSICVDGGVVSGSIGLVACVSGWRPDGYGAAMIRSRPACLASYSARSARPTSPSGPSWPSHSARPAEKVWPLGGHGPEVAQARDRISVGAVAQHRRDCLPALPGEAGSRGRRRPGRRPDRSATLFRPCLSNRQRARIHKYWHGHPGPSSRRSPVGNSGWRATARNGPPACMMLGAPASKAVGESAGRLAGESVQTATSTQGLPLPGPARQSFPCLMVPDLCVWRAARDSNPQPPDP
jgi:hypothetical protein